MKKIIFLIILSSIPIIGLCFNKIEMKSIIKTPKFFTLLENFFKENVKRIEGEDLITENKEGTIRYYFSKGFIDLYNYKIKVDNQSKFITQYRDCKIYKWKTETYWCDFDDLTVEVATNRFSVVLSMNVATQSKNCKNKSKSMNYFIDSTNTEKLAIKFIKELIDYFIDNFK